MWHITNRLIAAFDKHILRVNQISVDIINKLNPPVLIKLSRLGIWRNAEAHNHNMYMRFDACFAVPPEGAVRKIYMYAEAVIKRLPYRGDLLTLRNRVCRNKRGADIFAVAYIYIYIGRP